MTSEAAGAHATPWGIHPRRPLSAILLLALLGLLLLLDIGDMSLELAERDPLLEHLVDLGRSSSSGLGDDEPTGDSHDTSEAPEEESWRIRTGPVMTFRHSPVLTPHPAKDPPVFRFPLIMMGVTNEN
jgi:hypothetical protein